MHAGLVGDRALIGTPYLADEALRRQYAAEIAPRTTAALARIFAQLPPIAVKRVLDLGAGTGAAGQAARDRFSAGAVQVVSVDAVAAAPGVIVADLAQRVRPSGVEGRFDLILAAHLLNELAGRTTIEKRAALVRAWCDELLADGGHCILLEPALRETSRDLLAIRDRLLGDGDGLRVVAPCLHQGPCPARARERDWCHDAAPPLVAGRSRVDYSYLVLTRSGPADVPLDAALFRAVSDRMEEKGRTRVYGCGPAGRHALVRLDRDHSEANAAFDAVERGDLVRVEGATLAGDGLRIGREARVRAGRS